MNNHRYLDGPMAGQPCNLPVVLGYLYPTYYVRQVTGAEYVYAFNGQGFSFRGVR